MSDVEPTRWTFGEEALPQTEALAASLRRLTSAALAMEASDPALVDLLVSIDEVARELERRGPSDPGPRIGPGSSDPTDGRRVYLDHSRDIGRFNASFPIYELAVEGAKAHGTVSFPLAYEGPPGIVHGGFLAVLFDCAIQHHNCDVGVAGKTTGLDVRYRRPTPVLTELRLEITRSVADDRIRSEAELLLGDKLLASATMSAVAGNRSSLPAVSPRRTQP